MNIIVKQRYKKQRDKYKDCTKPKYAATGRNLIVWNLNKQLKTAVVLMCYNKNAILPKGTCTFARLVCSS